MGFASLQSLWAFYIGILAETPNPFPVVKGCVCLVGSASCRASGHTRPASVPGLNMGLPPSPRLGLRPKPHFYKLCRFIDRLIRTAKAVRTYIYISVSCPSTDTIATRHGMNLPLFCKAVLTAFSIPAQQGTSILTTVTLFISLFLIISVSFSA